MRDRSAVEFISTLDAPLTVLKRLRAIRGELSNGIYDSVQVVSVSNAFEVFIAFVNEKPRRRITKKMLFDAFEAPKSVVSNLVLKRHSPRMENFFLIVDGLIENFERELGLESISLDAMQGLPTHLVIVPSGLERELLILSGLLAELVEKIKVSNYLGSVLLGEFQRAQLIVILETALNQLKSPAIETNSLIKIPTWLKELAKRSANKGVDTVVGKLAAAVAAELVKVLKGLLS